ncbi:MAG: hypothetical protein KGI54_07635 [Pseudomonadota bacterium]|nr:hypothetical protein [Pseudomonadota bacterium]
MKFIFSITRLLFQMFKFQKKSSYTHHDALINNPERKDVPMSRGPRYPSQTKAMYLHLPTPVHQALSDWAVATEVPASRFVTALLSENLPLIQSLVKEVRQARATRQNFNLDRLKAVITEQIENV